MSAERVAAAVADRYRIERELGQGGMATVYLAHDLKHDRKVALKVLKPELAAVLGAERFVHEIKTTASLQHPHILPLFDSGAADGLLFYVMPFIKGETLREKLNRETQLGVDEAVRIAIDVADALQYAHDQGVIHRDIKPENILLANGRPLVADFGIALAVSAAAGGRMTETGLSLGTPHYMSPEQATADKEITGRSDVYSLASVLYEMLVGNPPHTGSSAQQIIMKIIAEPVQPVTTFRKSVPPNVAAALARALEKLPADRFHSAQAFAEALKNSAFTVPSLAAAHAAQQSASWKQRAAVPLAGALVVALAAVGWLWTKRAVPAPVTRFDLSVGAATPLPSSDVVISPDGSTLAFAGAVGAEPAAVYLRHLDGDAEFRKVPGSEGATGSPTFSPDSRSIAFRRVNDGALLKLDVPGGSATTLFRLGRELGSFLHWGTDDQIVYSGGPQGLFRISAAGGTPVYLAKTLGAGRYSFLLPDGSGVLFSTPAGVWVLDFKADSATLLLPDAVHPTYANGHLLYIGGSGGLFAVAFDPRSHRVVGAPARLLDKVAAATGRRGYSVSRSGILVYNEGASDLSGSATTPTRLEIVSFTGAVESLALPSNRHAMPRFSPDGRTIAYEVWANRGAAEFDVHAFDLASKTNTPVTFAGDNREPLWSHDGKRILFSKRIADGDRDVFVKPADNSGVEQPLVSMPGSEFPNDWVSDDTILLMSIQAGHFDLLRYSAKGGSPTEYLRAPSRLTDVTVSPDRKLAAFTSWETGNPNVWIRDYPVAQGKWSVSSVSGQAPRWSRDGQYLYFWKTLAASGDSLFRVRVDRTPAVVVRRPEFVTSLLIAISPRNWDLHPDGQRFIVAVPERTTGPLAGSATSSAAPMSRYLVALNWFDELRARTAGARK